jgi:hypothetical protein
VAVGLGEGVGSAVGVGLGVWPGVGGRDGVGVGREGLLVGVGMEVVAHAAASAPTTEAAPITNRRRVTSWSVV